MFCPPLRLFFFAIVPGSTKSGNFKKRHVKMEVSVMGINVPAFFETNRRSSIHPAGFVLHSNRAAGKRRTTVLKPGSPLLHQKPTGSRALAPDRLRPVLPKPGKQIFRTPLLSKTKKPLCHAVPCGHKSATVDSIKLSMTNLRGCMGMAPHCLLKNDTRYHVCQAPFLKNIL